MWKGLHMGGRIQGTWNCMVAQQDQAWENTTGLVDDDYQKHIPVY